MGSGTLIYIVIVVLGTIGKGLYEVYKKKQAALEVERLKRDREQAILRTGRDPATERQATVNTAAQREADLMAQRQEALRELRRQETGGGTAGGGGGGEGGTVRRQLWPGGPVVEVRVPAGGGGQGQPAPAPQRRQPEFRPPPQMVPQGGGRDGQRQGRQQQSKAQKKGRQQQVQARVPQQEVEESGSVQRERTIARLQASNSTPEPVVVAARPVELPRTRDQWRAALIAAEVFGPPVSLRGPVSH